MNISHVIRHIEAALEGAGYELKVVLLNRTILTGVLATYEDSFLSLRSYGTSDVFVAAQAIASIEAI